MNPRFRWCVVVLIFTSALFAQTPAKPKAKAKPQPISSAEDLQALRDELAAQRREIEQLREELHRRDQAWEQLQQQLQQQTSLAQSVRADSQSKIIAVQNTAAQQQETVSLLESNVAYIKDKAATGAVETQNEQKRVSVVEDQTARFRFDGDVRVRYEALFQEGAQQRNRERIRLRFGVEGKLNEDFTGGLYVASGAITNPTVTNETLTNFFERKTIAWDRGWITFQPRTQKWLQLTGGKFAFTWVRTPQTFDSDLNPEGFSQKLSFNLGNPILKNVTFTGMQLFFNEAPQGADSFAAGGQILGNVQLGDRWTMTPSFSLLNWRNTNAFFNAASSVTGNSAITCTLAGGAPVCALPNGVFAPNGMTNATVTVNGVTQFASQFAYADLLSDNSIKTGWTRFPWRVLLEYEDNVRAASNASHLYVVETSLGQLKEKNDLMFGYSWLRQEQDSVIASFVESEQRAPTNVLQHRFYLNWNVRRNATAIYTFWLGRTLNSSLANAVLAPGVVPGTKEPYLKRMQFDLVYRF